MYRLDAERLEHVAGGWLARITDRSTGPGRVRRSGGAPTPR
jgi:hypothetical protein